MQCGWIFDFETNYRNIFISRFFFTVNFLVNSGSNEVNNCKLDHNHSELLYIPTTG
jgi:hypothetical protein